MNVEKVRKILLTARNAEDQMEILARIARDVGHELPKKRLEVLMNFRAMVATLLDSFNDVGRSYLRALLEVVSAYECAIEDTQYIDRAVALAQTEGWSSVLRHLRHKPMRASQIIREFCLTHEKAPKMFSDMISAGFVCSSQAADSLYSLTMLGEKVAVRLTD